MPSRSSRSSPASRTSWSDPTGPASLAIAIGGTLAIVPVVGLADLSETRPRLGVAEGSREPRSVCGPGRDSERGGRLVVARQVGLEHRRVVGRDRAADARGDELRQRVLLERANDASADVGERADVEHGAAAGELGDETGILD